MVRSFSLAAIVAGLPATGPVRAWIKTIIKRRELPTVKHGARVLIKREDILHWVENNRA